MTGISAIRRHRRVRAVAGLMAGATISAAVLVGAAVPGSATTGSGPSAGTYTLVRGDTLWAVARRFGVTVAALVRANHIADPDRVRFGTHLVIPAASHPTNRQGRPASHPAPTPAPANRAAVRNHLRMAAVEAGVTPSLLEGLAWQESGWQQGVRSGAGAMGVGQLTMDTVAFVNAELVGRRLDPAQAADNIAMSAAYLAWLLRQTNGDVRLAVGAYYQGLASVRRSGLAPGTAHYVDNVLALSSRFAGGPDPAVASSP